MDKTYYFKQNYMKICYNLTENLIIWLTLIFKVRYCITSVVRKTTAVMKVVVNRLQQTICGDEDWSSPPVPEDFTLQPVRLEDELNNMERKLSDKQYMRNCVVSLHSNIFFLYMRNEKLSFSHFPNVCELFRSVASSANSSITSKYVGDFFKRVLRYVK